MLKILDKNKEWLDFRKLCLNLLHPIHQIESINYFTSKVDGKNDPDRPFRQSIFIQALENYIPVFKTYYGIFNKHKVNLPLANPRSKKKMELVIRTEEKKSDVNLAVHLLNDAWLDIYDCAILISNDSDLSEALRLAKKREKTIGLFLPNKANTSKSLMRHVDFIKRIRKGIMSKSQLPNPIPGTNMYKPKSW